MANLDNIVAELRARGLKVVETPGWITRGYAGQDLQAIRGVLWHHTATNRARFNGNNAPTLQMCIAGRPDVAGPLCNIVFGRDGTVYMVATGVANHGGSGGWRYDERGKLVNKFPGIPGDMANHYMIGIEMESSGIAPWDWTPEQLYWAPRLGAALEQIYLMGLPEDERIQIAHYEWSNQGKIDPAGWPGQMDGLRASINAILAGSAPAAPKPAPAPAPQPAPAPVTPSKPKGNGKVPYCILEDGDTLWSVSQQFNVPLDKIIAYNPGINPNVLPVGKKIYLINWCSVEKGDTGLAIARQMGVSFAYLSACNPGVDWNTLKVGQELWLE
jgi:LysM repeat protein